MRLIWPPADWEQHFPNEHSGALVVEQQGELHGVGQIVDRTVHPLLPTLDLSLSETGWAGEGALALYSALTGSRPEAVL